MKSEDLGEVAADWYVRRMPDVLSGVYSTSIESSNKGGVIMNTVVCISESVYGDALTRGELYEVLATDEDKRQIKIKGDNGRISWFPNYCFSSPETPVPTLEEFWPEEVYWLRDPVRGNLPIDVFVKLSDGETRWCTFVTPDHLKECGDTTEKGTYFHYRNRNFIIVDPFREDEIGEILRYIDGQGELIQCSLPISEFDEELGEVTAD